MCLQEIAVSSIAAGSGTVKLWNAALHFGALLRIVIDEMKLSSPD
jgi:hypothetical protein